MTSREICAHPNTCHLDRSCRALGDSAVERSQHLLSSTRAVDLNPNYFDAMQYLNLVYRRKADFDCTNPTARKQDITAADNWVVRAVAIRRAASEAPSRMN